MHLLWSTPILVATKVLNGEYQVHRSIGILCLIAGQTNNFNTKYLEGIKMKNIHQMYPNIENFDVRDINDTRSNTSVIPHSVKSDLNSSLNWALSSFKYSSFTRLGVQVPVELWVLQLELGAFKELVEEGYFNSIYKFSRNVWEEVDHCERFSPKGLIIM